MNIRATIAASLIGGLLLTGVAAPAHAEEDPAPTPEPTSCEETVQEYRDAATLLSHALQVESAESSRLAAQVAMLTNTVQQMRDQGIIGTAASETKDDDEDGWAAFRAKDAALDRLYLRHVKLLAKMTRLRAEVRYLRRNR